MSFRDIVADGNDMTDDEFIALPNTVMYTVSIIMHLSFKKGIALCLMEKRVLSVQINLSLFFALIALYTALSKEMALAYVSVWPIYMHVCSCS